MISWVPTDFACPSIYAFCSTYSLTCSPWQTSQGIKIFIFCSFHCKWGFAITMAHSGPDRRDFNPDMWCWVSAAPTTHSCYKSHHNSITRNLSSFYASLMSCKVDPFESEFLNTESEKYLPTIPMKHQNLHLHYAGFLLITLAISVLAGHHSWLQ